MPAADFIPFHRPSIGPEEIAEVARTLRSGWLTRGPRTEEFESEFRDYVGAGHALAVNSCTAGLHLALAALGVGPGDEVITTPLTFAATVHAILQAGATPVLADVGPDGNIDAERVRERIGPRTRAVLPVHLGGLSCDMDAIWKLAAERSLWVVEDAAHAAGGSGRARRIGGPGPDGPRSHAAAFSFHATKSMTTGEGGMVTTEDVALMGRMRRLSLHGIEKDGPDAGGPATPAYSVLEAGFKYNLSDIQAAIGIHQLRKLERFTEARTRYARIYSEAFSGSEELEAAPDRASFRHAWHLYAIRLNLGRLSINRDELADTLSREGIATSVHFIPIPHHPFFRPYLADTRNRCPEADALYRRTLSLPIYPAMTEAQVRHVAATVKRVLGASRRRPAAGHGP